MRYFFRKKERKKRKEEGIYHSYRAIYNFATRSNWRIVVYLYAATGCCPAVYVYAEL